MPNESLSTIPSLNCFTSRERLKKNNKNNPESLEGVGAIHRRSAPGGFPHSGSATSPPSMNRFHMHLSNIPLPSLPITVIDACRQENRLSTHQLVPCQNQIINLPNHPRAKSTSLQERSLDGKIFVLSSNFSSPPALECICLPTNETLRIHLLHTEIIETLFDPFQYD